jgi:hypothetical protein
MHGFHFSPCMLLHPHWLGSSYEGPHYEVSSNVLSLPPLIQIFSSNTISLYSSHNIRHQVSHLFRTTGKIIVLHILISYFLYIADEKALIGLNSNKCYPNLISS